MVLLFWEHAHGGIGHSFAGHIRFYCDKQFLYINGSQGRGSAITEQAYVCMITCKMEVWLTARLALIFRTRKCVATLSVHMTTTVTWHTAYL